MAVVNLRNATVYAHTRQYDEPSFLYWGYDSLLKRVWCAFTAHVWKYTGEEWHHDGSVSEHFKCTHCGKCGVH
jgi:hypothetical protein